MMERYRPDDTHMIRLDSIMLDFNLSFEEKPIIILNRQIGS